MGNFYTETIKKDPRFRANVRIASTSLLEPVTRRKVLAMVADLQARGIRCIVFETYRSQARQAALYAQGVTKLKRIGVHGFGLAADVVRLDRKGNPTWSLPYDEVGKAAKRQGLIWGGDWKFYDGPHVQRVRVADQAKLFNGSWYPSETYSPV